MLLINNSSIILLNIIFFSLQIVLSLYRNGNISEAEHLFSRLYDENGPDEVFCKIHTLLEMIIIFYQVYYNNCIVITINCQSKQFYANSLVVVDYEG